jgi:hypothetical protein
MLLRSQLPVAVWEQAGQQHPTELRPPAEEPRVAYERPEDVELAHSRRAAEELALLVVELVVGERRDAHGVGHGRRS